ncbi:toll/interleukin-1 receptor domain-containing protein [Emticicia sp. 17c]|uniref:toll/interleukin-1 receptor domain-containing protein n=1 Tax=Emticicia sp. 17c TaxID=3127704 RepID=UPI00301CFFB7
MYTYIDEDNSFDGINEQSTNDEIIDAILKRLYKSCETEYVSDWKISFLSDKRIKNIVEDMLAAKIVEIADIVYGTSNYPLKIIQNGKKIIEENGGWLNYSAIEKRKIQANLLIQTCERILYEIYDNGYIALSIDTEDLFKGIDRLFAEGLIYESQKAVYRLTAEGFRVVETGGFQNWLYIGKKQEIFATPKIDNKNMNAAQRLNLINQIALKLQADYNTKNINAFLTSYGFKEGLQGSVSSKRTYVNDILIKSNEGLLLLKMAKDLGIDISNISDSTETEQLNTKQTPMKASKIFLSHASDDSKIVDVFLEFLETIGVSDERIFYSSKSWTGVGIGEDFLDRIKSEINEDTIVITFLSENFYKSIVSICEMGAAWVKTEKTQAILIPPFDYSKMEGAIKKTKIVLKMDRTFRITELKEYIEKEMGLSPMSNTKWEHKRTKLLNEIARVLKLE